MRKITYVESIKIYCTSCCNMYSDLCAGTCSAAFFGVRTVIVDKSGDATNLPVGSVTYAIPEKSSEVSVGTPIPGTE